MSMETPKAEEGPERIVTKALSLNGKIYVAQNHALAYEKLEADNPDFNPDEKLHEVGYGFLTNKGNFVDNLDKDKFLEDKI